MLLCETRCYACLLFMQTVKHVLSYLTYVSLQCQSPSGCNNIGIQREHGLKRDLGPGVSCGAEHRAVHTSRTYCKLLMSCGARRTMAWSTAWIRR